MVFLANMEGLDLVITYGLFGIQHASATITPSKRATISELYQLLISSADRVDHLQDEEHGIQSSRPHSTTFVAYWLDSQKYEAWKNTAAVQEFWQRQPDDAGVWREVMTVPKSRFMFASSQDVPSGLGSLLSLKQSSDEGYWGVYRHRLSDTPDEHTDPDDTLTSPYITSIKAKPGNEKPVIEIPTPSTESVPQPRLGRVKITNVPDNMCFVREGQRQPNVSAEERDLWFEQISPHAQAWISHLDTQREKNGVMSFTTHIGHEHPTSREQFTAPDVDTEAVAETNQLAYFLDLAHFELAGRSHRGHVKLRETVMNLYGPGGKLQLGKAVLYVELCVLKQGDLDAEYIGCTEGTGLMFLDGLKH